ncbi:MAG: UvrD-helicase domain-containing protein [Deltaproteobacteria bacterium]|nr:UvrD-helicase domain-containing protein [Deltaproteobacteria bacterium]
MKLDLSVLNREQLEAVLHQEGPALVLAGAGSGKTRVITYRIARLIRDGVKPENVLAVTFTNKAAAEMRERVGHLVGRGGRKGLTVSTFHALGHKMLRECSDAAGLMPRFSIFDQGEQIGTVKRIFREVKIDDRRFDAKKVLAAISRLKNLGIAPDKAPLNDGDDYTLITKETYARYEATLRREQCVDFDDLLIKPVRALQNHPELRAYYRKKFQYLLVDEYQDTNPIQFQLLEQLCDRTGNLCVVGDDDQAIYAFRGADVEHILGFGKTFPSAKQIALTQNYRSTGRILGAANAIIAKNEKRNHKKLWTSFGEGDPIEVRSFDDAEQEAKFVADTILSAVHEGKRKHEDIAVLYRSNVQSQPIEEALRLEGIPYRVVGGMEYFERKEVKDALAYLRVVDNPNDEMSLRRIINYPARGLGEVGLEKMVAKGKELGVSLYEMLADPVADVKAKTRDALINLHALLGATRMKMATASAPAELARHVRELFEAIDFETTIYEELADNLTAAARKLENIAGIALALERFAQDPEEGAASTSPLTTFLSQVSLEGEESDDKDDDKRGVTLITIHGAKGLEWPWVFLVGMEEELLPHRRSVESVDAGDVSEERRLCYVGITRARERLWMSFATGRRRYGKVVPRTESRFLAELGETVQRMNTSATSLSDEQKDAMADDFFAKMRAKLGY